MKYILACLFLVMIAGTAMAQTSPDQNLITNQVTDKRPLVVIHNDHDFYEIGNDSIDTIDPDWLEKVEVLKGQSAINIFGERGNNGVVMITLKDDDKVIKKYIKGIKKNNKKF